MIREGEREKKGQENEQRNGRLLTAVQYTDGSRKRFGSNNCY